MAGFQPVTGKVSELRRWLWKIARLNRGRCNHANKVQRQSGVPGMCYCPDCDCYVYTRDGHGLEEHQRPA